MSVATEKKLLTAEEFYDFVHLPENRDRWLELVRGEVIEMPPPGKPHCATTANAVRILGNYTFSIGRFYVASNDCGVILKRDPDTVRGPDIGVYDDAAAFANLHPKYGEPVPLVAGEAVSPTDRMTQVIRKATEYLDAGVKLVWVILPEDRSVIVFRAGRAPITLGPQDALTGEDVLPGFSCRVCDLFRLPGEAVGA